MNLCLLVIVLLLLVTQCSQEATAFSIFDRKKSVTNHIEFNNSTIFSEDLKVLTRGDSRLSPVILLPGDGGSRLEAKLDRKDVLHHYCERRSDDWFTLWVNLSLLVPFAIDCWVEK